MHTSPAFCVNSFTAGNTYSLYHKDVAKHPRLSPEEEKTLPILASAGDEKAKSRLVEGSLRLVVRIAASYARRGLNLLDCIGDGNIGLVKAVQSFNPEKGQRFTKYAAYWIVQSIQRGHFKISGAAVIPEKVRQKARRILAVASEMSSQEGRTIGVREAAAELGMDPDYAEQIVDALENNEDFSVQAEDLVYLLGQRDVVDDGQTLLPQENVLPSLLECLTKVESKVIALRYGLDGKPIHTLAMVGAKLKHTRQRAFQIEHNALTKMRRHYSELQVIRSVNPQVLPASRPVERVGRGD